MNSNTFNKVIEDQINVCKDILVNKAKEYATEDRLHNFKNAAGMMGCDPKEALAGMMAKHTISIYDMCRDGKVHDIDLWKEKITDHINYLLLLKAIVTEEFTDSESVATLYGDNRPYVTLPDETVPTMDCKPIKLNTADFSSIDKVKKGLKICSNSFEGCDGCPYENIQDIYCGDVLRHDARATIEYLESQLNKDAT